MVNGVDFPARSRSVPASVCAPTPTVPVLNVSVLPAITGSAITWPSSVGAVTSTASLTLTTTDVSAATVAPSAGVELTMVGAALSMRIPVTTLVELLPSESEAVARRS